MPLYLPISQAKQELLCIVQPAMHVQESSVWAPSNNVRAPCPQFMQVLIPVKFEYLPISHLIQALDELAPDVTKNVPRTQSWQTVVGESPSVNLPAAHLLQVCIPTMFLYLPALHALHWPALEEKP